MIRKGRHPRRRGRPGPSFSARAQILLGAAEAFGRKGLAEAAVQDVLRAANVSRRTFYKFFRSKEDVFEQLCEATWTMFLRTLKNSIAAAASPLDQLSVGLDLFLQAPRTLGPLFDVLYQESLRPGTRLFQQREAGVEAVVDLFQDAVRAGSGATVDRWVLRGLIGSFERIALHLAHNGPTTDADLCQAKHAMLQIADATLAALTGKPVEEVLAHRSSWPGAS
jgi:AcrR family transcriptional regulator